MGKNCSISYFFPTDGIQQVVCLSYKQLLKIFLRSAVSMCMRPLPSQIPQAQMTQHRQKCRPQSFKQSFFKPRIHLFGFQPLEEPLPSSSFPEQPHHWLTWHTPGL